MVFEKCFSKRAWTFGNHEDLKETEEGIRPFFVWRCFKKRKYWLVRNEWGETNFTLYRFYTCSWQGRLLKLPPTGSLESSSAKQEPWYRLKLCLGFEALKRFCVAAVSSKKNDLRDLDNVKEKKKGKKGKSQRNHEDPLTAKDHYYGAQFTSLISAIWVYSEFLFY